MKLITFNKSKEITYFGEGKLQFVNCHFAKGLNLKLMEKVPEETLTLKFDQIYFCKNNLLCCIDQQSQDAFVIEFGSKETCHKIFDAILKAKSRQHLPSNDLIDEDKKFEVQFFIPTIKAILAGVVRHEELKTFILDFINSFDVEERCYYLNIATITFLKPSVLFKAGNVTTKNSRKRLIRNTSNNKENYTEKRPRKWTNLSYSCVEPSPMNSSDDVIFDIVEYLNNGQFEKKLLLFTSNERKQCYEFSYRCSRVFECIKCIAKKKITVIKAEIHNDGSKSFNFNESKHFCQPIDYVPENYLSSTIVKSPNFKFVPHEWKGKMKPGLVIFHPEDKNFCYKYGYNNYSKGFYCIECKNTMNKRHARFIRHNGSTSIELEHPHHVCQPKKYIPDPL